MQRGIKPKEISVLDGAQGRNRTTDTRIFSPLLYQLSYLAVKGILAGRVDYARRVQKVPPRRLRDKSTPSCLSLRYRCVRSSPVFSATRVIEPFSRERWNSK